MATQGGGAASLDRDEHSDVPPSEPGRTPVDESLRRSPYDIGQLQEWPAHLFVTVRKIFRVWRSCQTPAGSCGSEDNQPLNGAQVGARFEQVGSETVP